MALILGLGLSTDTYEVEGKKLVIPPPLGFMLVTSDMVEVYRVYQQLSDPLNDQIACFIPDSEAAKAMAGAMPSLERNFQVKVNKKLKKATISSPDFRKIKEYIKKENEELLKAVMNKMPGIMKEKSKDISKEYNVDFAVTISQYVPLAPHYETEASLAYSMYVNYDYTTNGEKTGTVVGGTATLVNVAGKILFLYCYAPKDELEWTRTVSKTWAKEVLAKNPKPPHRSSGINGIDWRSIAMKAVVWGCISGLIAMILALIQKSKGKKKDQASSGTKDTI
jgi:hypothetical protein